MRLKELQGYLEQVQPFKKPKVLLEQYPTTPHLAASMMFTVANSYDDIEGKVVWDLGCGCGMLSISAILLGSEFTVGVDIDMDALDTCLDNADKFAMETQLVQADLSADIPLRGLLPYCRIPGSSSVNKARGLCVDTVVMNPPFGTKKNQGADVRFLEVASYLRPESIYSLHKTSTRQYVASKASSFGLEAEVLAEMRFDLPKTMKFHKSKSIDIEVDLFRFTNL